jgi:hypothetical protein
VSGSVTGVVDDGTSTGKGGGATTAATAGAAETESLRFSSGPPKGGTCGGAEGGELALEELDSWTCFSDLVEK